MVPQAVESVAKDRPRHVEDLKKQGKWMSIEDAVLVIFGSNLMREDTYGTPTALSISLDSLKTAFAAQGCNQVFVKPLAPNDNSKNQIYLASNPDQLRGIPRTDWHVHD